MSLIRASRSLPEAWMVCANSTCFDVSVASRFSASSFERINRLFSGVRNSCDMFARNSDLYLEESANCSAFSSRARRASSTSWFLDSTWAFCSLSRLAFSSSCSFFCRSSSCCVRSSSSDLRSDSACRSNRSLVVFNSCCCACSSPVSDCDCLSRSSVRMFAAIVLSTMPMLSLSWSRKVRWMSLYRLNEASSMTALTSPSNSTGSTTMLWGLLSPRPELIWI